MPRRPTKCDGITGYRPLRNSEFQRRQFDPRVAEDAVALADRGMRLTDVPRNRVKIEQPPGHDERDYEIVVRALEAGQPKDRFFKLSLMPNRKTDLNNHRSISTDFVGMSWDYATADYAKRARIERAQATTGDAACSLNRPLPLRGREFTSQPRWR